jgi:hypothetical protein
MIFLRVDAEEEQQTVCQKTSAVLLRGLAVAVFDQGIGEVYC